MLNWLKGIWNSVGGSIQAVVNWFMSIMSSVVSYVLTLIDSLGSAIDQVWTFAYASYQWAAAFINSVYKYGIWIATVLVPNVIRWAQSAVGEVADYARAAFAWTVAESAKLVSQIESTAASLESWAIRSIWNPLSSNIGGIISWIAKEGMYAYTLVTHPDLLAEVLGRYILGSWVSLGRRFSRPVGQWLVHSMLSAVGDVGGIIEDIIASIL